VVVDRDYRCIVGATIQVAQGERAGATYTQQSACAEPDYGSGVFVPDLTPNTAVIVRAMAPGYASQDRALTPKAGALGATVFSLASVDSD
jgi:hypothetical protein